MSEEVPQSHSEAGVSSVPNGSKATKAVGRPITEDCGTEAAYKRHKRHGEKPCDPCKAAYNAAHRAYYAKRKGIT